MAINKDKNIRIQTTLNKDIHKQLLKIASKNNISASKLINQLVSEYVKNNE